MRRENYEFQTYWHMYLVWKREGINFEHLPPNKAFNFTPTKSVNGEVFIHASADKNRVPWDLSGLKYQNQ